MLECRPPRASRPSWVSMGSTWLSRSRQLVRCCWSLGCWLSGLAVCAHSRPWHWARAIYDLRLLALCDRISPLHIPATLIIQDELLMFIKFLLYISWAGATFSYIFVKSVIPHSYTLKYNIFLYNNFRYIVNFLTCRSFTLSFKFLASFNAGLDCFFRVPAVLMCRFNAVDPRAYNNSR